MANYNGFASLPSILNTGDTIRLNYTAGIQSWQPSNFNVRHIKVECYGGGGASGNATSKPGKGGYASGYIEPKNNILYFMTGSRGNMSSTSKVQGGGGAFGGGGATWISKVNRIPVSKEELYIVAAGGGGPSTYGSSNESGGHGGGLSGLPSPYANRNTEVGTQTTAGYYSSTAKHNGGFLFGGDGHSMTEGSGSGSGLYGGAGYWSGGSGGSSYIDGVSNGKTYDGYTTYGNRGHGYIIITILDPVVKYEINFIDKKDIYENIEPIKFILSGDVPYKLQVKIGSILIHEFINPSINTELEFIPTDEMFTYLPNGVAFISFLFFDTEEDDIESYEYIENFIKHSDTMIITTNPIEIETWDVAVDLNLNITKYTNIKIEACNNGFDEEPTWEDNTNRLLKGLNIRLTNATKIESKWGLRFKISVSDEFEMNELIVGGYYENIQKSHME